MKKRLLSLMLCAVMLLVMVPFGALADEGTEETAEQIPTTVNDIPASTSETVKEEIPAEPLPVNIVKDLDDDDQGAGEVQSSESPTEGSEIAPASEELEETQGSNGPALLEGEKAATTITNCTETNACDGDTVTLYATLMAGNTPLAGKKVDFYGKNLTTDENGIFSVQYPVSGTAGDTRIITANFAGDDEYEAAQGTAKVTIVANKYTVTFDVQGHGTAPESQKDIPEGNTATRPMDPTETGYTFGGWYKEAACTTEFNFSDPINADTTIYAKWTVKTYSVSFSTSHGSTPTTQTVEHGKTAVNPGSLSADGWSFGGWFADSVCTTSFNFTNPITADTVVYAKWTQISYSTYVATVTGAGYATIVGSTSQTVPYGSSATFCAQVTRSGYYIARVYVDGVNYGAPAYNSSNGLYYYTVTNSNTTSGTHTIAFRVYSTSTPVTGDGSGLGLFAAAMALSGAGIAIAAGKTKKKS